MIRQEITRKRNTRFSSWIRNNLPDTKTGFTAFDVDFILFNYRTKNIMIIEEKTNNSDLTYGQLKFLQRLDKIFEKGCLPNGYKYKGYYTLIFENNGFDNGNTFIVQNKISDKKQLITENEFIEFVNKSLENDNDI
tara:strand:- start:1535 stop:1942 length:408 start_codon:yes stop_codon:yes gene_type:complete